MAKKTVSRFTDRTIRTSQKWVKITRDNKVRTFTLALGNAGEYEAYRMHELKFYHVPNWSSAEQLAYRMVEFL